MNLTTATEGYTYFNKPGASEVEYKRDLGRCVSLAASLIPGGAFSDGKVTGQLNPMYSGILPGLMAGAQHQSRAQTNVENCMVVAYWRIIRLDAAQGESLWRMDRVALEQQLATWVGADDPPGQIVRLFKNDAARPETVIFGLPGAFGQASLKALSLKALDPSTLSLSPPPAPYHGADVRSKFLSAPIAKDKVTGVPAGLGIVVLSITGKASRCSECVVFQRFGPSADVQAWDADGKPDLFEFDSPYLRPTMERDGRKLYVFAVPPGKWRLNSRASIEFCLGAPAFDIQAGDVLYLGGFDLSAPLFRPDLATETAKNDLSELPSISNQLRPAIWHDGARWPCHSLYPIYSLRFEDAVISQP